MHHIRYFTAPAPEGGAGGSSTPNQGGNNTGEQTPDAGGEFKPITTQDDLNKIISDRVARERSKYADYKDLKSKADQLAKIEEANKTESQKLADAKAAAEKDAQEARAEAARLRVAAKYGISDDDADLFLTGTDTDTLTRQAERLSQRVEDRKKQGNRAPTEGANPKPTTSDDAAFARNLLGGGD